MTTVAADLRTGTMAADTMVSDGAAAEVDPDSCQPLQVESLHTNCKDSAAV